MLDMNLLGNESEDRAEKKEEGGENWFPF